jgi:hypothetical protein
MRSELRFVAGGHGVPGGVAEFAVLSDPVLVDKHTRVHVTEREERDRVMAGLVQQYHVLAVRDPLARELHAHTAPQRFGEQHSLRERLAGEEVADWPVAEWTLLPGQSHDRVPFVAVIKTRDGRVPARSRSCRPGR